VSRKQIGSDRHLFIAVHARNHRDLPALDDSVFPNICQAGE
jgi:hypothetical protein